METTVFAATRTVGARRLRVGHVVRVLGQWHRITRIVAYRGLHPQIGGFATAYWLNPAGAGECGMSLFDARRYTVLDVGRG